MMGSERPITYQDLLDLKEELLKEIRAIRTEKKTTQQSRPKYVKSKMARSILQLSAGKLQLLRIQGKLPYRKIGGTYYYAYDDIEKLLGI